MRDDTIHEQSDSRVYGRNNPSLGSQVDHVFNVIIISSSSIIRVSPKSSSSRAWIISLANAKW